MAADWWSIVLYTLFNILTATVSGHGSKPEIRIHQGFINVDDEVWLPPNSVSSFVPGNRYTFEVYMFDMYAQDYMIESCTYNNVEFIGAFGCVHCDQFVQHSIETEQYHNRPGALKRTLVHFFAPTSVISFQCKIKILQCCGCAEKSCDAQPSLFGIACSSYTTQFVGIGQDRYAVPPVIGTGYPVAGGRGIHYPWWIWLLLALLLLLLLLCCLAALAALCCRKKKKETTKTRVATVAENRAAGVAVGVGTDKKVVKEKGVGTAAANLSNNDTGLNITSTTTQNINNTNNHIHTIRPAIAVLDENEKGYSRNEQGFSRNTTVTGREQRQRRFEPREGSSRAGFYSVREGRIQEESSKSTFQRPLPRVDDESLHHERSSYRNFAFERDMGRVAPLGGYDEVEHRERNYCLSDDECDIIERDIKRTHTTRFYQETRPVEDIRLSDTGSERFREENIEHAVYAQSLPV